MDIEHGPSAREGGASSPLADGLAGDVAVGHQQRRAEALLAAERLLLELVATGEPLSSLLDALCLAFESLEDGALCSVLLVSPSGRQLMPGAAPSLSPEYTQALDGAPVCDDEGPCGAAALSRQPVIVHDFEHDTRWSERYLALVRRHALRAGWSAPILARSGEVLGTFAIYFREPRTPSRSQFHLIERFTHVASIAIARTRADDALRRSEAQLAAAQRLSATGSFTWRLDSGEIEWSQEVYRIFGVDPGTPLSLALARERVHPDDREHFDRIAGDAVAIGGELDFGHRLLLPGGVVRYVHTMATPVASENGTQRRYIGAVRDVTDQQRAEEALSRAHAELAHVARVATLGELTASIAHEVNQPLAGITMNADACLRLLSSAPRDLEPAREAVTRIRRDAQRAADVIVRLRELFRREPSRRSLLNLNEAIRDVVSMSQHALRRHEVALQLSLDDRLPPVTGDRVQLQQVVLNLVLNGVEALAEVADRRREITVRTEADADARVRVTVHDSGPGIDPAQAERIFDAFYTTKPGGTGMGLSIARTIIESHGGRLWADLEASPGMSFVFTHPP
jgi:PAS domain S-box-containing protein